MEDMWTTVVKRRFWTIFCLSTLAMIWLLCTRLSIGKSKFSFERGTRLLQRTTGNRTLGFGEIFMAILPSRTDQKDAAALLSFYSDIDITVIEGVTEVSRKTVPGGSGAPGLKDSELGCWRAHMNMLRTVVDKRLETALILEGDVDWDLRIKSQLMNLSEQLPDSSAKYPYGLAWMYLWIGNCRHVPNPNKALPFVAYADETVGELSDQIGWVQAELAHYGVKEDGKRVVAASFKPWCTTAYAVTLQGALRMLYELGNHNLTTAIDAEYAKATVAGRLPGLSVTPPFMGQWRTGLAADSDIRNTKVANMSNFKIGSGPQVRQSARKGLEGNVYAESTLPWANGLN